MILNRNLFFIKRLLQNVRHFHCSHARNKAAYEGSGKTTVNIINIDDRANILIDKCTPMGFFFNNGAAMMGPLVIFPKTILCWNISSGNDINEKSLSLFTVLEPKPDIVVVGLETQYEYSKILKMKEALRDKQINVEILPTDIACGIYNFLCNEGRYVGAALIPPLKAENPIHKRLKANLDTIQKQKLTAS